ncbi:MAG: GNAT family N-acetyltransferase [Gammaproteobacteria bacterium]|nr:GNAT family N-acetyltransferase [Gammaproteobacteria bacterium]
MAAEPAKPAKPKQAQHSPSDAEPAYEIAPRLNAAAKHEWNALEGGGHVFMRHEFLNALETRDCAGPKFGWHPRHILARDAGGALCAAMPMYAKTNGYGEFVFDWAWERAYAQRDMRYYPKLVVAAPYTPVTAARLLCAPGDPRRARLHDGLTAAALAVAEDADCSGVHWLFLPDAERARFERLGLALRLDCQYHWHNNRYRDFDDFLSALSSKRRKTIARERRRVREQGIECRVLHGGDIDAAMWRKIHAFYASTFDRKWGYATLSADFFTDIGRSLPDRVVVVVASCRGEDIACAVNLRDDDKLYGRYWGCSGRYECLHFEACYYRGIDYCIEHQLRAFEPGAQGENKIWRGFLPTPTWSAHWLKDPAFMRAADRFCREERALKTAQIAALYRSSPYREETMPATQRAVRDACLRAER